MKSSTGELAGRSKFLTTDARLIAISIASASPPAGPSHSHGVCRGEFHHSNECLESLTQKRRRRCLEPYDDEVNWSLDFKQELVGSLRRSSYNAL